MHYLAVVHHLQRYQKVVVTGPQRSGTTVTTKMLANDLGLPCLLEEACDGVNVRDFFKTFEREPKFVLQAPSMAAFCHHLKDCAVVFMMRDLADIIASQDRVSWGGEWADLERMRYFCQTNEEPAKLKYHFWHTYQKALIGKDAFELDYETANGHPFWLDKQYRVHFNTRQTS